MTAKAFIGKFQRQAVQEEIEYIGIGDKVVYRGECVEYRGRVVGVDYTSERALVRVNREYQFWAGIERLELVQGKALTPAFTAAVSA